MTFIAFIRAFVKTHSFFSTYPSCMMKLMVLSLVVLSFHKTQRPCPALFTRLLTTIFFEQRRCCVGANIRLNTQLLH